MKKEQKLYELSKELVYQMTGNYTEDVQDADLQIAWVYLEKAMDYIQCCKSDSELLTDKIEIPKFPKNRIINNTRPFAIKKKG